MQKNTEPALKDSVAEYLFHEGTNYKAYEYFGAHEDDGEIVFRVWAPRAESVVLTGDFCGWNGGVAMTKNDDGGIWAVRVGTDIIKNGCKYKFIIERDGEYRHKADPFAFYSETEIHTASIYYDFSSLDGYAWTDSEYIEKRKAKAEFLKKDIVPPEPMSVYEVHLGSWKHGKDGGYLNYREYADLLSEYVIDMGYTHIELMPVMEHPFDGSWGYQICGYYAPTSRYGNPADFQYFVDRMHSVGIGVILDWVPAHFPKDGHGLYEFDGSPLYEYQGKDRMENASWGTRCFDLGRSQVRSFLISNALFWLEKYHIDGIRIDAVASMLYLDYDRKPGEWNPNPDGTNINSDAVAFLKMLNTAVKKEYPECYMIAEESTAFANVTKQHGLGFSMKWNMGWMNDAFSYVSADPLFRHGMHDKMTFSLHYAFSESYMLPVSHDEVVHGKRSLVDKMCGTYEQKFACARTFLAYMMTHPGKKLLFMGSEFAQFREWDVKSELEWFMLDYEMHSCFRDYVKSLNRLYASTPALWELDDSWDGFRWIYPNNSSDNVFAYERFDKNGEGVIIVLNFAAKAYENYFIPLSGHGVYEVILESDLKCFGGEEKHPTTAYTACKNTKGSCGIEIKIPALSSIILRNTNNPL